MEKVAGESIFTERLEGAKRTATENRWRGEACLRGEHEAMENQPPYVIQIWHNPHGVHFWLCLHCRAVFVAR